MSEPIDAHTLNVCLARVIGKSIKEYYTSHPFDPPERKRGPYWYCKDENGSEVVWHPVTNANQMEEVEAWVIKGHHIQYTKYVNQPKWGVSIWNDKGKIKGAGSDPDKKRAFALAIWQMGQSNNNHKED